MTDLTCDNYNSTIAIRSRIRRFNMAIDFDRQKFFWSRVGQDGEHLIWSGTKVPRGYGIITINGREEYAHRVSWCIASSIDLSAIDDYHLVRINCNKNDCVEPGHLALKPKTPSLIAKEKERKQRRRN